MAPREPEPWEYRPGYERKYGSPDYVDREQYDEDAEYRAFVDRTTRYRRWS